ncbi:MAG: transcription termination factor Rho [Thermoleophilaceae bacterium]|jgi:transcription termination factor Rho|nr:transcription termination factor Rho [Thermoleophilaceae bacterium]
MAVLKRNELEQSPLADLHALAADLGLEGFRRLRKDDLIGLMVGDAPADEDSGSKEENAPAKRPARSRAPKKAPKADADSGEGSGRAAKSPGGEEEVRTGILDILGNGSGFLRADADEQSKDDIYISPAQIRRCELKAGDEVTGPVRPPRRSERYPSLVRVETINGTDADTITPPERSDRPDRSERSGGGRSAPAAEPKTPAVFATKRFSMTTPLKATPFGRGSRVVISGPPGAGSTTLLREIAKKLAKEPDLALTVVLAGVRPEEVGEWSSELEGATIEGGSFDQAPDRQADAARSAVEAATKAAEGGDHAAVVIDSLDAFSPDMTRRILGAARNSEDSGSVTVIAACSDPRTHRYATTRIVLSPKGDGSIDAAASGTLRAELLK